MPWVLKDRPLWGDYGWTYNHGHLNAEREDHIVISRSGPFVPAISQPIGLRGAFVLREDAMQALEQALAEEVRCVPVRLQKVVRVDWTGSPDDEPPRRFTEPCSNIESARHAPKLAESMPDLWCVYPKRTLAESNEPWSLIARKGYRVIVDRTGRDLLEPWLGHSTRLEAC